jgi:uncharacterized protein YgiM (DUF1202 family)
MKRSIIFMLFGILILQGVPAQSLMGRTMYVTIKNAKLKSSTAFFAEVRGTLKYGDQVTVLNEYRNWVEVQASADTSRRGWIASANLTTKRILSSSGSSSASADELALAGKGFSQEVENAYRQNGNLNYDALDILEAENISNQQLFDFLLEGRLARGEH